MKKLAVVLLSSLLWFGCQKENSNLIPLEIEEKQTVDQDHTSEEATQRGNQTRPFKGSIVYNFASDVDLVCDCTNGVTVQLEGSGNITHMGKVSSPATYCMTFNTAENCPVGHTVLKECLYVIAANGDEVHLNVDTPYESCVEPDCCLTGTLTGTFEGGTGRFQNAEGEWTAEFIQYLGSTTSEVTVDGEIVY